MFELRINHGSGRQVQNFGTGSVSVSIPYILGANESASNVQAVYVDASGAVHWLANSVYDSVNRVLRFSTTHFSTYGVGYKQANPAFTDTASHWAKDDIAFAVSRGLLDGTSATTFSPNSALTRGMFVAALGRLSNTDVSLYKRSSFTNVKNDAYYMGYIEWANKNYILTGVGNGKFAPDQAITRAQMAVIMQEKQI
ncbi:Endo-1,4-beta-xylanase A [bioreactor metagenome]|uniref:Endo-1,4-beta-xylanase A n=1 Tax=bioreactor metagenome TaxID=1076179 RepID=A0A645I7Z4_9ZZZZ